MSFRFSILIILLFKLLFGFSQNKLDSLKAELANKKDPIDIISYQIAIGEIYEYTKPDSGAVFYKEALDLAKKIDNDTLYITALLRIGYTMELTGKADSAEHIYLSALKLLNKDTKAGLKGSVFNSLGNIYYYKSDFEKSLSNYQKALEQYESIHSELFQSYAYHNIALVHDDIGEFELALKYYKKAEATFLKYNDKSWLATCYNSLGSLYNRVDSLVLAEQYYKKSLTEYQALGDKIGMSIIYENIARCYNKREIYDMSLIYLNKALEISTETNDDYSLTSIHMGMAKTYYYKEDYDKVIQNSMISLRHARLSDFNSYFVSNYELLKNTYTKLKNYQLALQYYDSLSIAKQDIFSLEKNKAIQEMEKKYQTKENELKIIKLEKSQILKAEENKRQKIFLIITSLGFLIILIFSFFLGKTIRAKKRANQILKDQRNEISEQNEELNQLVEETMSQKEEIEKQQTRLQDQNDELEQIHLHLSQSIEYAKRIQKSILPKPELLLQNISDHFLVFHPKDVVSGDFFWWAKVENNLIVTAADCTGHGVPGAFMSMLGVSFLREIVVKEYITHPGVILRKLRKDIINALQQKGISGEQKDGMDMSLVSINLDSLILQYSGANNPIYVLKTNDNWEENDSMKLILSSIESKKYLYEIKPDKMPIAIYENMSRFSSHELQLEKGDQLYMFTDGFADQFGGEKGKKFKYKPFKQLILANANLKMKEQKAKLESSLKAWQKDYEQVDDILVLGIKI